MGDLKMKVTHRSCRERVNELLKKFRTEEGLILRSTGATDDKITEIKKLLIDINEMALTKPQAIHSNLYTKRARTDGESIRDAALRELSDYEPDDYIQGKYSHSIGDSRKRPRTNEEIEHVIGVNDFFNDEPMTSLQQEIMDQELEMGETQDDINTNEAIHVVDADSDSDYNGRQNVRENETQAQQSTEEHLDCQPMDVNDNLESVIDRQANENNALPLPVSTTAPASSCLDRRSNVVRDLAPQSANIHVDYPVRENMRNSSSTQGSSPATTSIRNERASASSTRQSATSNNRFSNSKKDLIGYLNSKSENELIIRREDIRLRALELENKKEELDILRLNTVAENEERMRCREIEAQNKKEELKILRLKTEAEAEERKKIQDLLITLLTKNN